MTFSRRFFLIPAIVGILLLLFTVFSCTFVDATHMCVPNQFVNGRDSFVYLRYIRDAQQGAVAFFDHSTNEPQRIGIVNVFWAGVGRFGNVFHLSPVAALSFFRLLSPLILIMTLFWVSGFLTQDARERRWLVLLAAAMGGTHILFSASLISYYLTPSLIISSFLYPLPAALAPANTTIATALITLSLLLFFRWTHTKRLRDLLISSCVGVFLLQFQPYLFPVMAFVPFAWMIVTRTQHRVADWISLALMLFAWCVPIGYLTLIVLTDPFTAARFSANVTPSGYLIVNLALLAIPGYFALRAYRALAYQPIRDFLVLWIASSILFAHLPFIPTQVRFFEGIGIPFSLLVALGLLRAAESVRSRRLFTQLAFFMTVGALLYVPSAAYAMLNLRYSAFTLPTDIIDIRDALVRAPVGTVLATESEAYYLLAETPDSLYIAHEHETVDYLAKHSFRSDVMNGVLRGDALLDALRSRHINYVVLPYNCKADRAVLDPLHLSPHYELYRVPPTPASS